MKTIVDLSNCDAWADDLTERCVNQSTQQHLLKFFKMLYKFTVRSDVLDVSDRTKLKLETSLDRGVFVSKWEPRRLLNGYRLKIDVVDPKGNVLSWTCYLATTKGDKFYKVHSTNDVRSWAKSK